MRAAPIDLPATGATPELLVVDFRERFEPLNYFRLGNLSKSRVAADAAGKWSDESKQIKTADYFDGLFVGVL